MTKALNDHQELSEGRGWRKPLLGDADKWEIFRPRTLKAETTALSLINKKEDKILQEI